MRTEGGYNTAYDLIRHKRPRAVVNKHGFGICGTRSKPFFTDLLTALSAAHTSESFPMIPVSQLLHTEKPVPPYNENNI